MENTNKISKTNMQEIINKYISEITSEDILKLWNSYKCMYGLDKIDLQSERDILTLLKINNLNPFKKEAYIIPFNGRPTVVVAYQTLLKRVYEYGYDSRDFSFKEEKLKTYRVDAKGNIIEKEDLQCTAYMSTSEGKCYSFSVLLGECSRNTAVWREKPVFMLRKCAISGLCRTLPGTDLSAMPYTREELEGISTVYEEQ
uniref:recombinase RecT n=1 Tax=Borrelia persica TaxID=44448 RepID=UPI000464E501